MKNMNSKNLHNEQIQKKRRRKWYYTVSLTMAAVVVFCTVYALILPAITMEKQQQMLDCPLNIHQHTEQCYDSDKNLICGEADFVIHTHNDGCFDEDNNLMCKLPKIVEHKHGKSCYNEKDKLICKLPEVEEHKHNNLCYAKDGTLICGKLQTTRHVHGPACFKKSESTNDTANKNEIVSLSDITSAANSADGWGYNDAGSIWWGDLEVTQVAASAIQENTRYIISGYQGNNLMADETYTKETATYLKAIPKEQMNDYNQYQRWCFEKVDEDGNYYIYFLKTNEDGSTAPFYLQFAGYGVEEWGNKTLQTTLTNDKVQATVFKVAKCTDGAYPDHITISADVDGKTFYINSYFGDKPASNGNTTHWLGYEEYSEGSFLKVSQYHPQSENTAKRVKTDTSTNSVINLFDYWITPNRTDPDDVNPVPNLLETGINKNHAFKFTKGAASGSYPLNYWTGAGQLPRSGVVSSNLDSSGYPVLSGNNDINGTDSTESLRYLFDPTYEHEGKASYRHVGGLLILDNDDYYSFSCNKNMAEFNEENNNIYLYDKPGVTGSGTGGQFFPFNKAPQIMTAARDSHVMNHYFGMTITTRFIQRHDGYTSNDKNTKTTFHFSGDDDVWIFIDGVLVGDVGGIHDASSVDIDFATGEVQVAVAGGTKAPKTTIKECYQRAGKENSVLWNGNTYANNTTHTLKFYYLERGNYASNLELKFNLTEIPKTAIQKTNEYGKAVQGAKFAVYAADSSYNMLKEKNGTIVQNLPDEVNYDENGNIIDSAGQILANALYFGTSDANGEMVFVDKDGMPYTINELHDLFGDNFILRELEVPEGYRIVSKNTHLRIFQGENQKILVCDNVEDSGSCSATDLHVTATDIIHLRKPYIGSGEFNGKTAIQYCNPDTGTPFGTLFAVIFKYTGEIDENGDITGGLYDEHCWTPVYGNDEKGYFLVDTTDSKGITEASIDAAKEAQKYGNVAFSHSTSNSTMKLMLDNLPGDITSYYSMLSKDQKKKTRYTVSYYWTDQPSVDLATPENTYGVSTYASTLADGSHYSGFERIFSAEIKVPNLINDVFVQKVDENNKLINGANFALYQVQQADNGEILYCATASDGTTSYIPLPQGVKPDPETGVITVDGKSITPLTTDVTKTFEDGIHTGTVRFVNLADGQYIIKEIKAPPGYYLNTSDIMVLVTENIIYANAGTEDDGITVGRGPGYLVGPMHQFASQGQIDNTLTWIYAQMRISKESKSFADVGNESMNKEGYLMNNYSSETTLDPSKIFKTYLIYAKDKTGTPFNYVPDPVRNEGKDSDGYRRLFTTSGWPYYEVYQDYAYGSVEAKKNGANYQNWSDRQLTNLFSRSSYIRVTDTGETTLKVRKADPVSPNVVLNGAKLRLYKMQTQEDGTPDISKPNTKLYYSWDSENKKVKWTDVESEALVITTGENDETDAFTGLKDDVYYLEEIKAPDGYNKLKEPVKLILEKAKLTLDSESPPGEQIAEVNDGVLDENNLYTYTVTVYNYTGFELPASGGIGTMIFYISGGILFVGSFVFLVVRRRMSTKEKTK